MFPSSSPVINRGIFERRSSCRKIEGREGGDHVGVIRRCSVFQLSTIMDAARKELAKLEKLTSSAKSKTSSIPSTLDSLLQSLRDERDRVQAGTATPETMQAMSSSVETAKKDLDERQKEIYNSMSRYGKALDKVVLHSSLHTSNRSSLDDRNSPAHYQHARPCSLLQSQPPLWTGLWRYIFCEQDSSPRQKPSSRCEASMINALI